jgi:flagellar biosynthetic protein FliR
LIETMVLSFSLILARVGAFVSVLPLLGAGGTPRTVKAGLSAALAVMYFLILGRSAVPESLAGAGTVSWLAFAVVLLKEALLGAFLGYAMGLVLLPVQIAGDYLGQEMGLALAAQADPTATNPSLVISQVFQMLAGVLFLGLDGHHLFFAALHGTFLRIPVGGWSGLSAAGPMVTGLASAQEWGLMLAAPVGAILFLTSVVLALLTRVAPQMNLFSIGFGLRVGIGLAATFLLLPNFVSALVRTIAHVSALLERLVG